MPNIETRDRFAKFDIDATLGDIKTDLAKIYRKALTAFVREMASKIPVLTGQARSSVIGAAKELGLDPRISLSAAPVTNDPKHKAIMMARGNNPKRGRTLGHGTLVLSDKQGTFRLTIFVTERKSGYDYFAKWDEDEWHSLEAGRAALKEVVEKELTRLSIKLRTKNG